MPEYENRTKSELDAALRTLLRQKPLEELRVRELTEFCGLRRQSFYYHFRDVFDLFAWSMARERALLLDQQANCMTWRQVLLALLRRIEEERPFYQAVLSQGGQASLGAMIPLEDVLEAAQAYYRKRNGSLPDPAAEALERRCGQTVLLSLAESWARNQLPLTPEEIADSLERTTERSAEGAVWRTLREQGTWSGTP